jgi:hypothetical protein
VLQDLAQMGAAALGMVGAAMEALARQLPEDDQRMLEWGVRMYVVSRQLERIGDNAVDIGEQVAFLITGQFHEFTDASHPEIEHPTVVGLGDAAQADPALAPRWLARPGEGAGPAARVIAWGVAIGEAELQPQVVVAKWRWGRSGSQRRGSGWPGRGLTVRTHSSPVG